MLKVWTKMWFSDNIRPIVANPLCLNVEICSMDYSIEELKENIYNSKTKLYFEEVFNSYLAKSYRSANVMLWTVLICDLWFKIEDLSDRYDDSKAKKLLSDVKDFKDKETRDLTKWEYYLVDEIFTRLNIIDSYTKQSIDHLKDDRNLCAHPTLTSDSLLFSPSRERTISHMKSILENVLTKPPFLSKDILSRMLEDIALIKDSFLTDEQLEKYVASKYIPRFQPETNVEIYKGLWKIVFKLEDESCSRNREINFRILKLLFKKDKVKCLENMSSEKEYFTNISNREELLVLLVKFLISDFDIWNKLSLDNKLVVEGCVRKDVDLLLRFYASQGSQEKCFFGLKMATEVIEENLKNRIVLRIEKETVSYLYSKNFGDNYIIELNIYVILRYGASLSFNAADSNFYNLIKPFWENYSIDDFKTLVSCINENDQTYARSGSIRDHSMLLAFITERFSANDIEFVKEIKEYDKLVLYLEQQEQSVTF